VAGGLENLRGRAVAVVLEGRPRRGVIITHVRNDRWLVEFDRYGRDMLGFPLRLILNRTGFDLL